MQDDAMSAELDGPDASTMPKAGLSEILAPGLSVVFCGLNPALSAVRDGHNFSNPSNRFWRVLHLAGFTPRLLRADEERALLQYGCGLTSAVSRPTKSASELKRQDYLSAAPVLETRYESLRQPIWPFLERRHTRLSVFEPMLNGVGSPRNLPAHASGCCQIRAASTEPSP